MGIFEEAAIFRGVTKEDARQMLNCLNPVEKTYKKDEIIYHAGDEVTSMGVVLSGSVFIENDDIWGNHSILDRAGRGEIFAETYAAIPGQKLMVNVVAAEEARILFLDVGRILKVCSNSCVFHHTLIENLLKLSAEKNLRLSKRIFHISSKSIRGRLLSYLSYQAMENGKKEFDIPFNRQQLADYLNVDRSAMSNELGKMQKDRLIEVDRKHFRILDETEICETGRPLFSSHMLDLSEEPMEENMAICREYLARMDKLGMTLEIEIGITGGEEDGVDNSGVDESRLYTQPSDVLYVYDQLNPVSPNFTVAAAFGNVHGVYKPGNVKLKPSILGASQEFVAKERNLPAKPINFVFHGGSGSSREEIREAISYGAIKMNIDTDTQWAAWNGILNFYKANEAYLQGQLGNPEGPDAPNKKYYDPRVWLRKMEESMSKRLEQSFEDLNCVDVL